MSHPAGLTGREIGEWYRNQANRGGGPRRQVLTEQEREALKLQKRMRDDDPQKIQLSSKSLEAIELARTAVQQARAPVRDEKSRRPPGSLPYRPPNKRREALEKGPVRGALPRSVSPNPLQDARKTLPAWKTRRELVDLVRDSSVVVVSGETGCGKTTQVPQFLLDADSNANIVCTQPRRISAVAVAERVAAERACTIGSEVGYQIRLEGRSSEQTRMLFCTTGILLRRLQFDPDLEGVTHVIVDEIHERTLDADFLLIILRDLLRKQASEPSQKPKTKVILMSATLNPALFSNYFGGAPILHIPGFTHPVTEYFLEDAVQVTGYQFEVPRQQPPGRPNYASAEWRAKKRALKERDPQAIKEHLRVAFEQKGKSFSAATIESIANAADAEQIPLDLIEQLCAHIDDNDADKSAILIFLPGWDEISKLCEMLGSPRSRFRDRKKYRVLPLHSSLPTSNQREIFERPPNGSRKIIVSTNIAETSITVDDVVFVIDSGKFKEKTYDASTNVSCLLPALISQASARQRRGRAGRVQPGVCYHLFSSVDHGNLKEFQLPEMLRTPLESLCLQVKALKHDDAAGFLRKAIEPPDSQAIQNALELLRVIGALEMEQERLTELGQHLSELPIDPRLGKILIYAVIFQCLDPVLTIAASLGFRNPFVMAMDKKAEADRAKLEFASGLSSDHAAYFYAYAGWKAAGGSRSGGSYAWRNFLSHSSMCMIDEMKDQFRRLLTDSGFVLREDAYDDSQGLLNANSKSWPVVIGVLTAGLYPNIARVDFGRKRVKLTTKNDGRIKLHPGSVNDERTQFGHHWLTFYEKVRSSNLFVLDSSPVPPLALCLFGGELSADKSSLDVYVAAGDENIGSQGQRSEQNPYPAFLGFKVASSDSKNGILMLRELVDYMVARRVQSPGSRGHPGDMEITQAVRMVCEESIEDVHPGSSRMDISSKYGDSSDDGDEETNRGDRRSGSSHSRGRGPRGRGGGNRGNRGGRGVSDYRGGHRSRGGRGSSQNVGQQGSW